MNRRSLLSALPSLALVATVTPSLRDAFAAPTLPKVEVYKTPTCGCCGAWVEHMRAAGFSLNVHDVGDTTAVRAKLGMPDRYGSCHSASVGGYVLEGHVPADEVKRLLATRPQALGLAMPGMVPSSPGMDVPGRNDPYEVLLIDRQGGSRVFARYPKPAAKG